MYTYMLQRSSDGKEQLQFILDGNAYPVTNDHVNWSKILEAVTQGAPEEEIKDLLSTRNSILSQIGITSEENTFSDDTLYDISTSIADLSEKENQDLLRSLNVVSRAKREVIEWLNIAGLRVYNGYIVGYKGVSSNELNSSVHNGPCVITIGEESLYTDLTHNFDGAIVSMPEGMVTDNPDEGCSYGLHVGSWDYANGFGSVVKLVLVDPGDIISVPNDCDFQKMRVSKYTVLHTVSSPSDPIREDVQVDENIRYNPTGRTSPPVWGGFPAVSFYFYHEPDPYDEEWDEEEWDEDEWDSDYDEGWDEDEWDEDVNDPVDEDPVDEEVFTIRDLARRAGYREVYNFLRAAHLVYPDLEEDDSVTRDAAKKILGKCGKIEAVKLMNEL